jgi:hypothetical protein
MEDGDVVLAQMADLPQFLHYLGLVSAVDDLVPLHHEPARHDLRLGFTIRL